MINAARLAASALTLLVLAVPAESSEHHDTVSIIAEKTYLVRNVDSFGVPLAALAYSDDSIQFVSWEGLFVGCGPTPPWKRLMDCVPFEESVPSSACRKAELQRIVRPSGLWRVEGHNQVETLLLEGFCGRLYSIQEDSDGEFFSRPWRKRKGNDFFDQINIQENIILIGLARFSDQSAIAIEYTDRPGYRRLFDTPSSLNHRLDSLMCSSGQSLAIPALNPMDSTIWLAITTYDYIYIIDLEGQLMDSLCIDAPDYLLPPPPKSRVKSNAVFNEWFQQWTPISSFIYSSAGYFLLQYYRVITEQGTPIGKRYTTLAWNSARRRVTLDIAPQWSLVGARADGRLIFAHPVDPNNRDRGYSLTVVRLQP